MKNIRFKYKNLPPSVWVVILGLFIVGCEKTINIAPPQYEPKISIQCLLTPDSFPKLYLDKSVPFFDYKVLPKDLFIPNASVKITAANGAMDVLKADSIFNQFYCRYDYFYKGAVKTKANTAYSLEVVVNGQTFKATTSTNLPKAKIETVGYVQAFSDVYGEHEGVVVTVRDVAGQANFYRYQMIRMIDTSVAGANIKLKSACLGRDSILYTEIGRTAFDDIGLDGGIVKMTVEPAFTHKKGVKGVIRVQILDENTAAFYNNVDNQKVATYNPFVEPVFLKTQIDGCIGIFGAYILSEPVAFVYPE